MNANNKGLNRPEKNFKVGAVRAAIWQNSLTGRDCKPFKVKKAVLERRYRNKEGEWKSTNSYAVNDIPKAILVLHKAYEPPL